MRFVLERFTNQALEYVEQFREIPFVYSSDHAPHSPRSSLELLRCRRYIVITRTNAS
jgi:hypothetical protein